MSQIDELLNDHVDYIQHVLGQSKHTVKNRKCFVRQFIKMSSVDSVTDITNETLEKWVINQRKQAHAKGEELTGKTINTKMCHLKSFLIWCEKRGHDSKVKYHHIDRVPEVRPVSKFYTREQIVQVLAIADTRESLMINILFDTLMRRSELAALHISNIKGREINFVGKGNKKCTAIMSEPTVKLLRDWIDTYDIDGYIFPSAQGHICPDRIGNIIKGVFARAGIPGVTAHAMRHSGATELELNGAPIQLISRLLNHSKLDTTRIYTHATEVRLIESRDKYMKSLSLAY